MNFIGTIMLGLISVLDNMITNSNQMFMRLEMFLLRHWVYQCTVVYAVQMYTQCENVHKMYTGQATFLSLAYFPIVNFHTIVLDHLELKWILIQRYIEHLICLS